SLVQIGAGKLEIKESETDLAESCRLAYDLLKDQIAAKNLCFDLDAPPELPLIRADARAMRQISVNLLSNAVKFTPPQGAIVMRITCNLTEGLTPAVTDTGFDIPESELDRVFEPYARIADPSIRRHDGVGLGLASVRALTELHGDIVRIHSALGHGTTVFVTLPPHRVVGRRPSSDAGMGATAS
ncbi:MAG: hypothetical protein FJX52_12970, partial [Alphaproteobacteria bacterium]|nr:hypothetical protein [Alphaproteobacteria bacterium]